MSSVANNMVATLMNSQGANLKASVNKASSGNAFQNILNRQTNIREFDRESFNAYRDERTAAKDVASVNDTDSQPVKETKSPELSDRTDTAKPVEDTEALNEKVDNLKEEATSEVKDLSKGSNRTKEVLEERMKTLETVMLDHISSLLGIDTETLETMMDDMGMTPMDLMSMKNISSLVTEFFGIDSFSELLTHEEAATAIRKIDSVFKAVTEDLAKELDIEVGSLRSMIQGHMSPEKSGEAVSAEVQLQTAQVDTETAKTSDTTVTAEGEDVKLEVVDERSTSETTEYSQDNTGNEDKSFAQLMAGNAEMTKEVTVVTSDNQVVYKEVSAGEVINQIVTKAVVNLSDEKTTMQLQLNPEHLGKIGVQVTSEQGIVKGQFVAENHVVKEMIESNIVQLKEQLEEQGIKVDKIEVTVGNSNQFFQEQKEQQQQSKQQQANRRRINRLSRMRNISEVVDFISEDKEVIVPHMNIMTEHTVDYSA